MQVKAPACELPTRRDQPCSRWRVAGLAAETRSGIAPFDRLVADVMTQPPYAEVRRVFWIVESGSAHRRERSVAPVAGTAPSPGLGPRARPPELAEHLAG